MKREERSEYTYLKNDLKKNGWNYGTIMTIRTNASAEYKQALHQLYTDYGFHPAGIRTDNHILDGQERILYIYGLTFDLDGVEHPWTELYTAEEKKRFENALR